MHQNAFLAKIQQHISRQRKNELKIKFVGLYRAFNLNQKKTTYPIKIS